LEKAYGIPKVATDKVLEPDDGMEDGMEVLFADWRQDEANKLLLEYLDGLVWTKNRPSQLVSRLLNKPPIISEFTESLKNEKDDIKSEAINIFQDLVRPPFDISHVRSNFKKAMEMKWTLVSRVHLRNANYIVA